MTNPNIENHEEQAAYVVWTDDNPDFAMQAIANVVEQTNQPKNSRRDQYARADRDWDLSF